MNMNSSYLLSGKFTAVKLPDVCAPRHALINLFHEKSSKRIIYVSTPAGYGKTVSTQLWLKKSGRVPLWIDLDEYDNTLFAYYKLICTGISALQPDNKAMADILASPAFSLSPVEHTINLLSAFTPDDRQYAIVLDDMHLVTNVEIRKSGLLVQKRLPSSFVMVILTRNEVPEKYISLIGEENCSVITASDLAFSAVEIQKYLRDHGRFITMEEAETARAVTNGWAIGVNALAISGQMELSQNSGQFLGDYIKTQIWDKWDETVQSFLLKTSILDEITPELAEKLTGEPAGRDILEKLCADNMFVSKTENGHYRYHHLFSEFLRGMLEKQTTIDLNALNRETARNFYEEGQYYLAAEYYSRCGDDNGISRSIEMLNNYTNNLSMEEQFHNIKLLANNAMDKVSEEFLKNNMHLVEIFTWYYFLSGNAKLFLHYIDILYANMQTVEGSSPALLESVLFIFGLDFREDFHVYSQMLARKLEGTGVQNTRSWLLTQNLPFAHRTVRDYSEFAFDTETRLSYLESAFAPIIGKEYYVIEDCILAGLFYEKNLLVKAMEYAVSARGKCQDDFSIESKLCLQMISMAISQAMDKPEAQVNDIAGMLGAENAPYMYHNLLAYEAKVKLWHTDKQAAKAWLDNYFVTETVNLEFFNIFQHFTSARAYMVLAQADKAMDYILKLKKLGTDYNRPLDIAEASVLQAVLEWALGDKKEALATLEEALIAIQEYGFIRVVADEGAAILPILKRLALNLKKEGYPTTLNAHFLNEATIAAYEQSKRYKGIAANVRSLKPVKLSKQQKRIIALMSKGYKNAEIVEETKLTIHTVKSHQAAAYAKLGVNSAMDAVIRAKELGIIG